MIQEVRCHPRRSGHSKSRIQEGQHQRHRPRFLLEDSDVSLDIARLPGKLRNGDASCPCLSQDELVELVELYSARTDNVDGENANVATTTEYSSTGAAVGVTDTDVGNSTNTASVVQDSTNSNSFMQDVVNNSYGLGCTQHDLGTESCAEVDECTTKFPVPPDCEKSYCQRSWCYVDARNCNVYHSVNKRGINPHIHYSYATCGHMDSFTYAERRKALRGKTLQVALNSNTGGWMGAYNPQGSFSTQASLWTGPLVEFLKDAAHRGGFELNVTRPPAWLEANAQRFFGQSSFDYCVYATSLGYLDLCVAAYTITDKRASVTPFLEMGSDPVYLVTFSDDLTGTTYSDTVMRSLMTIFQPFTYGSWIMIAFICLPLLGLLMVRKNCDLHLNCLLCSQVPVSCRHLL